MLNWLQKRTDKRVWTETLDWVVEPVEDLPGFLERAGDSLSLARRERAENAYAPYWDAVYAASKQLAYFGNNLSGLRQLSRDYEAFRRELRDGGGNFPEHLFRTAGTPNPRKVLDEYREVVRLGQTDIAFAMILEERRAEPFGILEFEDFGDAIVNLPKAVEEAYLAFIGTERETAT